jgi:hypothetical protein
VEDTSAYALFYYGPGKNIRAGTVFQDFRTVPGAKKGNVNAVQYLWADTGAGSEVYARVLKDQPVLKVNFKAAPNSYPCNVAIRGKEEAPLLNEPSRKYLTFRARLSDETVAGPTPVAVAIRVVNGLLEHWVYGTGASAYICEPILSSTWQTVRVDLSDVSSWRRFESDGNPATRSPANFDCICSVILEIGRQGTNRPDREGEGTVEIGPLVLLDNDSEYELHFPNSTSEPKVFLDMPVS